MKKLLLLFLMVGSAYAQVPVRLTFNNEFAANDTIFIFEYYAGRNNLIQKINPFTNAEYSLNLPSHAGLFLIQLKGEPAMAQFIYNPADVLGIGVRKSELRQGIIYFSEDRENACYTYIMKASQIYDYRMDSIQRLLFGLDKSDVQFNRRYKSLDSMYYATAFEKNYTLSYVRFMYENSYCDQSIIPILLIPLVPPLEKKTYQSWIHYTIQNYFEHAVVNQQLLYNNLLETQIMRYINNFGNAPNWNAAFCVDRIYNKFSSDSVVSSVIADYLITIALKAEAFKFAQYVDEKFSMGCKVPRNDWETLFSKDASKVFRGGFVNNANLINLNGGKRQLNKQFKKGTNWLLLFSEPCDSSLRPLKSLLSVAQKNENDNKLAVYIGNDKNQWVNLIEKYKLSGWTHLSELLSFDQSLLVKSLLVNRTALLYQLDENGFIQKRYISPADY